MSDNSQKTDYVDDAVDTPLALGAEAETPDDEKNPPKGKRFKSFGERMHRIITYWGIDGAVNTLGAVSVAYWARFTNSGQKYWTQPIDRFFRKLLSPMVRNEETLAKSSGYGAMFISIMMGGTLIIPPLLLLESKKRRLKIIKFFDRLRYGKEKVENDPRFQQAYEEAENAPKKDFWTGTLARIAALIPLITLVMIPTAKPGEKEKWYNFTRRQFNEKVFGPIGKGAEWTGDRLGLFKKLSPEKKHFIYHEGLAVDLGITIPYAVLLHPTFFDLFAAIKRKMTKKKPEAEKSQDSAKVTVEAMPEQSAIKPEQQKQFIAAKPDQPSTHISGAEVTALSQNPAPARIH